MLPRVYLHPACTSWRGLMRFAYRVAIRAAYRVNDIIIVPIALPRFRSGNLPARASQGERINCPLWRNRRDIIKYVRATRRPLYLRTIWAAVLRARRPASGAIRKAESIGGMAWSATSWRVHGENRLPRRSPRRVLYVEDEWKVGYPTKVCSMSRFSFSGIATSERARRYFCAVK